MTGEFSRRSFLKYTALTAVAVAGSSLLTGCSGYAPVQHAVGTSNTVLKVVSTLDWVEYDEETNTTLFRLVVTNGRKNALEVTKANFAVKGRGLPCLSERQAAGDLPGFSEPSGQAGRNLHLLCESKGPERADRRPCDPYLLP